MAIAPCREKTHEMFLGHKNEFQAPLDGSFSSERAFHLQSTENLRCFQDDQFDKAVEVAHHLVGCRPLDMIWMHHSPPQGLVSLQSA